MEGESWSAKVSRAVYSPIQLYLTVDWTIKPDVLAAYIAENGDGYYENGVKLWDYDALEVCGSEIMLPKGIASFQTYSDIGSRSKLHSCYG